MNFRRIVQGLALGALFVAADSASAQTNVSDNFNIYYGGSAYRFTNFTVSSAGNFSFAEFSTIDTYLYLFNGHASSGATLGTYTGIGNDDAYGACGGNYFDSCLSTYLVSGDYTAATTFCCGGEQGYRNETLNGEGYQPYSYYGSNVTLQITSQDGGAEITDETTTPEPASMVLLATGLIGVGAAARRRKAAR